MDRQYPVPRAPSLPLASFVAVQIKTNEVSMADNKAPEMQATLGLTGLTMNAMALMAA